MAHFRRGEPAAAIPWYERVLGRQPDHAQALHFLGLAHHQSNNSVHGLALMRRAVELDRNQPVYAINLGAVLAELGQADEAAVLLQRAERQGANTPDLFNNLALVHLRRNDPARAAQACRRALAMRADFPGALNNLGEACARQGLFPQAIAAFEQARQLAPRAVAVHTNLGHAHLSAGQASRARECFESALVLEPCYPEAILGLVRILEEHHELAAALERCRQGVAAHPRHARLLVQMGTLTRLMGRLEEAVGFFRQAVAAAPRFFPAHWRAELALPMVYRTDDEMAACRNRWLAGLENLRQGLARQAFDPATVILPETNFYLHYQGENDREAQAGYGRLVTQIARLNTTGLAAPVCRGGVARRKIKVGFASAFFSLHTIFKLFHGWIVKLDREAFETTVFHFSPTWEKPTEYLRQHAGRVIAGALPLQAAAEAVARAELDVLIYPDIGMDAFTQILAALRLAPVQCQAWGHPVTSGLPSIDYFLSSALMEPAGAQAHYHEKLVCLPDLSIWYPEPDAALAQEPTGYPVRGRGARFVCLQSLFKLPPRQDALFARIAQRVPRSEFVFIRHPSQPLTELYRQRLEGAFRRAGVDPAGRLHYLPPLRYGEFLGLARNADVILDSVGWSGGNTTLEALVFDKPIVTLPGALLRGRHTMAILRQIGVEETIAQNEAEYVEISARLAEDSAERARIAGRIHGNKSRAYYGEPPLRALETFLREAASGPPPAH